MRFLMSLQKQVLVCGCSLACGEFLRPTSSSMDIGRMAWVPVRAGSALVMTRREHDARSCKGARPGQTLRGGL